MIADIMATLPGIERLSKGVLEWDITDGGIRFLRKIIPDFESAKIHDVYNGQPILKIDGKLYAFCHKNALAPFFYKLRRVSR